MLLHRISSAVWMALLPACLAAPSIAWAQQQTPQFYGPHMWAGGWHGWFFGPIMMIVFIAIVVVLVMFLMRKTGGSGGDALSHRSAGNTPLDILKERFARGEIDKEEFEERRRVLSE